MSDPRLSVIRASTLAQLRQVLITLNKISSGPHGQRLEPLSSTLELLEKHGVQAVVVQRFIQDPDALAEYQAYYSKAFAHYDRLTTRLHFFGSDPDTTITDALDFLDKCAAEGSPYLGFITLRSVPASPVGATIVKPPAATTITCIEEFPVHIAGLDFRVCGAPFMQQDSAVGACAQAAIWMALRTLRKREGDRAYDPAQITNAATRFLVLGRSMPNRSGLVAEQMMEAIRSAGYAAHVLRFRGPHDNVLNVDGIRNVKRALFPYVLSGIPVVIGVFPPGDVGHALMVLGFDKAQARADDIADVVSSSDRTKVLNSFLNGASWVTSLRVHNDNSGPYLPMASTPPTPTDLGYFIEQSGFAIPLLPGDVFLSAEEAAAASTDLLQWVTEKLFPAGKLQWPKDDLAIQLSLIERWRFRKSVLESNAALPLKRYYREKVLPKRLWLVEISYADNYGDDAASRRQIAEVLIDPTGDPTEAPFLAIHLNCRELGQSGNGVVVDRDPDTRAMQVLPIPGDVVYGSFRTH